MSVEARGGIREKDDPVPTHAAGQVPMLGPVRYEYEGATDEWPIYFGGLVFVGAPAAWEDIGLCTRESPNWVNLHPMRAKSQGGNRWVLRPLDEAHRRVCEAAWALMEHDHEDIYNGTNLALLCRENYPADDPTTTDPAAVTCRDCAQMITRSEGKGEKR